MKNENISFETALKRLEEIAAELEKENISLDGSLKLYEEGVGLVRYCKETLESAQRRVNMLTLDANGEILEKEFPREGDQI